METTESSQSPELDFQNLKALKTLGKGALGTVFLVYDRTADPTARNPFALKVVDTCSLSAKPDSERRARWETTVLSRLSHPFLPSLLASFHSHGLIAWAVPYCPGGDLNVLRYHQNDRVFSPAVIRFYIAEIVSALEHLHSMGIAYRDLKPENVLIQSSGHVTLTDFDLCRSLKKRSAVAVSDVEIRRNHRRKSARVSPVSRRRASFCDGERSNSFVGTEEYVAPEVVRGEGHEFAVDWWALGILTFEMLYGTTPFKGKNRKETFRNVVTKRAEFLGKPTPLTEFISRLLEKDPTRRLGYARGAREVKEHPFFAGVRWDLLTEVMRPPFIPGRDDGELTAEGFDVREYFEKLRSPPSISTSPDFQRFTEF